MRRIGILLLSVVMLCGAFGGSLAIAQDATPAATGDHPLVGAWLFVDQANPESPYSVDIFHADGTYVTMDGEGAAAGGVWDATGPNSADLTFVTFQPEGRGVIRADVELAQDGQSLTATYTFELVGPDGTSTGQIGPGMVEATKLTVEPQGTPVGSFEDVFGAPPVGTPEATPAG